MQKLRGPIYPNVDPAPDSWSDVGKMAANHMVSHPGTLESLVPVWGSAREAMADAYDGDYAGAVGNGLLAAADLIPGTAAAKAGFRTAKYIDRFGPMAGHAADWKAVRQWMGKQGYVGKGQPMHHLIEKNGPLGKQLPDWLKNSPLNTMPMPDAQTHGRIHHKWKDLPQYDLRERIKYGTPDAVKFAARVNAGKALMASKGASENKR